MLTIESELKARVYAHKFAVVGAYYVMTQTEQTGELNLPLPILQAQAVETMPYYIQSLLEQGIFDYVYEQAWDSMKDKLPNDFIFG